MGDIFQNTIPAHVPPALVFDWDFWKLPTPTTEPFSHFTDLPAKGAPPIFYTPRNGGHWVFCTYDLVYEGYSNWQLFSNYPTGIPRRPGGPDKLKPHELDPPEHTKYRQILSPLFSPLAVRNLEDHIRELAAGLVDAVADRGHCDFIGDFSAQLPTGVFLEVVGLPREELPQFMAWEEVAMRAPTHEEKAKGYEAIYAYLQRFVAEKAKDPGSGVTGALLRYRDETGAPLSQEDVVASVNLLYLAGLDTVMNTMGFIWQYLAKTPEARRFIRENPDKIGGAVDEFIRYFAVAALSRAVRADMEFKGIVMKAGDLVLLPTMDANRDSAWLADADQVKLERERTQHTTFGAGIHRCLGLHLAKTEIALCLEEWFRRVPDFGIEAGAEIPTVTGHTVGINALPLVWNRP